MSGTSNPIQVNGKSRNSFNFPQKGTLTPTHVEDGTQDSCSAMRTRMLGTLRAPVICSRHLPAEQVSICSGPSGQAGRGAVTREKASRQELVLQDEV